MPVVLFLKTKSFARQHRQHCRVFGVGLGVTAFLCIFVGLLYFFILAKRTNSPSHYYFAPISEGSQYRLYKYVDASNFSNEFSFQTHADYNAGTVEYLNYNDALENSVFRNDGGTFNLTAVKSSNQVPLSVFASSRSVYNGGMFIFDVNHLPFDCGAWP